MASSFATFPGLLIRHADLVLTHGVTPSVCDVVAVLQDTNVTTGTLVFGEAGVPTITFPDCAIDRAWDSPPYVKRGQRLHLRILDRRWRWRGQRISGRYNVRRPDAVATTDTRKTYTELIELLLEALGEQDYEIDSVADLDGPTVEWSCARADLELAWLVEELGCVVVLGLDNRVHIMQRGAGELYPPNGRERIPQVTFWPATSPWKAQVEYGPTRYQSKLLLEAVGLDKDGTVVPIDKLSYKPSGGWRTQVPGVYNDVENDENRAMARESVYRWYRVKEQFDGTLTLPGGTDTIESIDDILPLSEDLIVPPAFLGRAPNSFENDPPDKAFIEGYFWDGDLKGVNEKEDEFATWDDRFQLDGARGIVKFDEYMFQVASDGHHDPAELYLECSYSARANPTAARWHHDQSVLTGVGHSQESGIASIRRSDLFLWVVQEYGYVQIPGESPSDEPVQVFQPTHTHTNSPTITEHGEALATAYARTFQGLPHRDQQWTGILPFGVSGRYLQMRWVISVNKALTYGSMHSEVPHWGPSYAERRLRERVERSLP